jgi:uncharacterized membrane protein
MMKTVLTSIVTAWGVIIAGIFGAATLKWTTLLIQTAPGAIAIFLVWISRWKDSGSQKNQAVNQ